MLTIRRVKVEICPVEFSAGRLADLSVSVEAGGTVHGFLRRIEADDFHSLLDLILDEAKRHFLDRLAQARETPWNRPVPEFNPYAFHPRQLEAPYELAWAQRRLMARPNPNFFAPANAADPAARPATANDGRGTPLGTPGDGAAAPVNPESAPLLGSQPQEPTQFPWPSAPPR